MSAEVHALELNNLTTGPRLAASDAELATFRGSSAWKLANPHDREAAERPMLEERRALAEALLPKQQPLLAAVRRAYLAASPAAEQRRAAVANPARAAEFAELARLAGPLEAARLAQRLVVEEDAAGAYGLRLALAQAQGGDSHSEVVAVALKAGTKDSDAALRALLAAQREYARSVALVATDPIETLNAAHLAQLVEQEDGTFVHYREEEIERLIGPPQPVGTSA